MCGMEEKKKVPRCSLQVSPEMKAQTSSADHGGEGLLKYVIERKTMEKSSESMSSAGRKK